MLHDKLLEILDYKKFEVKRMELPSISRSKQILNPLNFLKSKPFICEVKKASPSIGDINTDVDVVSQAENYQKYGAGAISVLTDEKFFKGSFEYLKCISEAVKIPTLCKDFIISERQIQKAYLCGADFILLIAAALKYDELKKLKSCAEDIGLNILFEIHEYDEYEMIKTLNPNIVGVNSRNLKTFIIDKDYAANVITKIPDNIFKVAESGIEIEKDVEFFSDAGADAFLIGTSLMKSNNLEYTFDSFYSVLKKG